MRTFCRTCPKTDPRFKDLVSRATQNFDTFEDLGSNLDSTEGKKRVENASLDQFFDYRYRRAQKPRMPFSNAMLDFQNEVGPMKTRERV